MLEHHRSPTTRNAAAAAAAELLSPRSHSAALKANISAGRGWPPTPTAHLEKSKAGTSASRIESAAAAADAALSAARLGFAAAKDLGAAAAIAVPTATATPKNTELIRMHGCSWIGCFRLDDFCTRGAFAIEIHDVAGVEALPYV
jgi:hypothetical protein